MKDRVYAYLKTVPEGKVTTYGYNANTNVLEWVQYPEDTAATRTEYTYDTLISIERGLQCENRKKCSVGDQKE